MNCGQYTDRIKLFNFNSSYLNALLPWQNFLFSNFTIFVRIPKFEKKLKCYIGEGTLLRLFLEPQKARPLILSLVFNIFLKYFSPYVVCFINKVLQGLDENEKGNP